MVSTNLDLDTLRTLAVAMDLGGFRQAADALGRTPSAVSLQMKRLQETTGATLFRKQGRGIALTEDGERVLATARRMLTLNDQLLDDLHGAAAAGTLRLGCPQDLAPLLPALLESFSALYPRVHIDLRVEGNGVLATATAAGELDLAALFTATPTAGAVPFASVPIEWISTAAFQRDANEPLPLALLGPQCIFRKRALASLEEAGIPVRIAATSGSLEGVWAAVRSGIAITARTALNLPAGLVTQPSPHQLPPLGNMLLEMHTGPTASAPGLEAMQAMLQSALNPTMSEYATEP